MAGGERIRPFDLYCVLRETSAMRLRRLFMGNSLSDLEDLLIPLIATNPLNLGWERHSVRIGCLRLRLHDRRALREDLA
jgi:hypothetical protein